MYIFSREIVIAIFFKSNNTLLLTLCLPGQDHVRAAMTCIRFFTHGASSYRQLGEQQVFF